MDKQWLNRITVAFLALTVLVVAVMLSGTLQRPSRITLPSSEQTPGQTAAAGDALTVVEVTPETVQTAIATLSRPLEYRRTVTVELLWSGGSGAYETAAAVSGGWTRTDRTLSGGRIRHALTDGKTTYIWYDSETAVYHAPAGGISADDEQTIPTYEEILDLPVEAIAAADYRTISGVSCIYVETAEDSDGYVLRYWVSVDTGLLAVSERLLDGEPVYRMAALALDQEAPTAEDFTLPDGTAPASGELSYNTPAATPSDPSPAAPSGGDALKPGAATVVNGGNGVWVRSGPGTDYRILAAVPNGGSVQVIQGVGNDWYEITFFNADGVATGGYMKGEFLSN